MTYSAREVAALVGVPESRVRYWAQTGFVGPSERAQGRPAYTFQDLVQVKAAKELLDRGVSLQRARKNLEALRVQLPQLRRPLAQVRLVSDGDRLLVTDEHGTFEPVSGQVVMELDMGALERAGELAALPAPNPPADSAYARFLDGVRCEEEGRDEQAMAAYRQALEGDPRLAAAHTNLGSLLYRRGERGEARELYQQALALDPEQPEARYNLANLLDELGERERALGEWYRVVTACPEFADAHFNLAAALLESGAPVRARVHLERYLALSPQGEWADRARSLIDTASL